MTECRYCGNAHDVRDLCRARRVSRRSFLFSAIAAPIAAATVLKAGAPYVPQAFGEILLLEPRPIPPGYERILARQAALVDEMTGLYGLLAADDESPRTWRSPYLAHSREGWQ